jgi:glutathione S-transferase
MIFYTFPGCPYCERIEVMIAAKNLASAVQVVDLDISAPRPAWLLEKTCGTTALPALEVDGRTIKESLAIMRYLEMRFPEPAVAQRDPLLHAIECMFVELGGPFAGAGYAMIRNRDAAKREELTAAVDAQYAKLDRFLRDYGRGREFLFERLGWAEVALAPLAKRLEFLNYYEGYEIPSTLTRVRAWHEACLAHPATQDHTVAEIVRLYYDYSRGAGGGSLPPGRTVSTMTLSPHWSKRPMPPRDKWSAPEASDAELGLI